MIFWRRNLPPFAGKKYEFFYGVGQKDRRYSELLVKFGDLEYLSFSEDLCSLLFFNMVQRAASKM
jgi:hypothetical protein